MTVGYARKSRTKESKEARVKSLTLQVQKLKVKFLCGKVYVSSFSDADEPLCNRDIKSNDFMIKHSDCNCQDLFGFLSISNKKIRPTVLSYAGLSTNPDEVRNFVKLQKRICEIIAD
ncbi:hypothetical protein RMCBS344292_12811 [Rhizopus microsporus]|nr:hypothetical protein RMCBS344292_12811 [Rhizopus microsporus]